MPWKATLRCSAAENSLVRKRSSLRGRPGRCLEDVLSLGGEGWELSDGTVSVGGKRRQKVQGSERWRYSSCVFY